MNKPLNKMAVEPINGESTLLCSPGQVLAEVLRDELEQSVQRSAAIR